MGFGLFISFALMVVVLTNSTLERSRTINDEINRVYSPSVDALVRLRNLLVNAHQLIKSWALNESRADAREKIALVQLTSQTLPALLDRMDTLSANWSRDEVALMNRVFGEMDELFTLHDSVKRMLPGIESYRYDDPLVFMARQEIAEEGGRSTPRPTRC